MGVGVGVGVGAGVGVGVGVRGRVRVRVRAEKFKVACRGAGAVRKIAKLDPDIIQQYQELPLAHSHLPGYAHRVENLFTVPPMPADSKV